MRRKKIIKSKVFRWGCFLLLSLFLALIIRFFFFESFRMPSKQMETAILSGDFLLADKTAYGIRFLDKIVNPQKAQRNDIVVYNDSLGQVRISRCVALPGDTLEVKGSDYFVNGKKLSQNPDMIIPCFYDIQSDTEMQICMRKLNIPNRKTTYDHGNGTVFISRYELYKLKDALSDSIRLEPANENVLYYKVVIPKNSYWMLSDNSLVSEDSRHLGFIPQKDLIGKIKIVWLSKDPEENLFYGYRWNRFLLKTD